MTINVDFSLSKSISVELCGETSWFGFKKFLVCLPCMLYQQIVSVEAHGATRVIAMVQLSFGVSSMMILLVSPGWKALWAIKAFVRFFTRVCPLVHHQVRQTSEFSLTHLLCISFWAYLIIYKICIIQSTYL